MLLYKSNDTDPTKIQHPKYYIRERVQWPKFCRPDTWNKISLKKSLWKLKAYLITLLLVPFESKLVKDTSHMDLFSNRLRSYQCKHDTKWINVCLLYLKKTCHDSKFCLTCSCRVCSLRSNWLLCHSIKISRAKTIQERLNSFIIVQFWNCRAFSSPIR